MADVFVSWSSADKDIVLPLSKALENAGFTVDEYSKDPSGGSILRNVSRYVDEARVAIVVLSADSVSKPWIQTEVDWCYGRRAREGEGLPEIIPLIVGDVADAMLPHLIQKDPLLRKFPISTGALSNNDEFKLKETVRIALKLPAPVVVPAAFLAMNQEQARALLETAEVKSALFTLCGTVGMEPFPRLKEALLRRYGKIAEEFSPFPGGTLKDMVQDTIADTNKARNSRSDKTPLWVWWCTDALLDGTHRDFGLASQLWERGPSIAIVDSISVLHPMIYKQFTDLPDPREAASSALLWVPPYTLHTAQLEEVTEDSVKTLLKLLYKVQKWGSESGGSYLAFDIGTRATLRRWIHQAFVNVTSKPTPIADNIAAMRQVQQSQFEKGSFWTQQ